MLGTVIFTRCLSLLRCVAVLATNERVGGHCCGCDLQPAKCPGVVWRVFWPDVALPLRVVFRLLSGVRSLFPGLEEEIPRGGEAATLANEVPGVRKVGEPGLVGCSTSRG